MCDCACWRELPSLWAAQAWLPKGPADSTASVMSPLPQLSCTQPQEGQVRFLLHWGLHRPFHCCSQQDPPLPCRYRAFLVPSSWVPRDYFSSSDLKALPCPGDAFKHYVLMESRGDQAWHHLNTNGHLYYPLLLIMFFSHSSIHNGITKLSPPCREGNSRATGNVLEHLTCGCASSACWCFLNGNCSVKDTTWKKSYCRQSCLESTARELKPFVSNSPCYLLSKHPSSITL